MIEAILKIGGMKCGGCVSRVSSVLEAQPGVRVETVTVGRAKVQLDPAQATPARLIRALGDAGYTASEE